MSADFRDRMEMEQVAWRRKHVNDRRRGSQNGRRYDHVLPRESWEENLWPGIRSGGVDSLPGYLTEHGIQRHTGSHNLLSSWMLCANLYFPFRRDESLRQLLASFLRHQIAEEILDVSGVELEFAHPTTHHLHPAALLGEMDGQRGSGQTSPDVAFLIRLANGRNGIVLTESKFTEHSFYACSGRKRSSDNRRTGNPARERCLNASAVLTDPKGQCHLVSWGRRYWEHLLPIANGTTFAVIKGCPASHAGYQLLRQHALAEGFARAGLYGLVVSAVAYDERNKSLFGSLSRRGIEDWGTLFSGDVRFRRFTHQSWVRWVREHDAERCADWLRYIETRYQF